MHLDKDVDFLTKVKEKFVFWSNDLVMKRQNEKILNLKNKNIYFNVLEAKTYGLVGNFDKYKTVLLTNRKNLYQTSKLMKRKVILGYVLNFQFF